MTEKTEGDSKEMCVTARAYICICGAAQFGAAGAYTCNAFFMQLDRKHYLSMKLCHVLGR